MDSTKTLAGLNPDILRFIKYASFKADCLREQEANPLLVDRSKAKGHWEELNKIKSEKTEALRKAMPKRKIMNAKNKPKVMTKKDGSLSSNGIKWYEFLHSQGLPRDTEGPVGYIDGEEDGNPNSHAQVKEWLHSLGWKPCTYKYDRDKATGEEKKIEQVRYSSQGHPRKGELCDSVVALKSKDPAVEILEGLSIATHRMSVFEGFLKHSDEGGICHAGAQGLTNTLRFKHRVPFVNLPKADGSVPWGKEIRGCIVAPEGKLMCGSDVSSLEDSTKRHYMFDLDPVYVEEMSVDGFDPHMKLLQIAGDISEEEYNYFIDFSGDTPTDEYKRLKAMRSPAKTTNYSALYGVGKAKLARESGMSQKRAGELLEAFWKLNWSIKKVAKDSYVKTLRDGTMWVLNPVSGFYYSLRNDRDIWSTLNQGTGVYIFDQWVARVRKKGILVRMQYHDEVMFFCDKGMERESERKLKEAMKEVNEALNLNVEVKVDVQFGRSYSDVH